MTKEDDNMTSWQDETIDDMTKRLTTRQLMTQLKDSMLDPPSATSSVLPPPLSRSRMLPPRNFTFDLADISPIHSFLLYSLVDVDIVSDNADNPVLVVFIPFGSDGGGCGAVVCVVVGIVVVFVGRVVFEASKGRRDEAAAGDLARPRLPRPPQQVGRRLPLRRRKW